MRKFSIICSIISGVLMLALIACVLPESVPIRYDIHGQAVAMGSKWTYTLFALLPLLIAVSFEIYCRKGINQKNRKVEEKVVPLLPFVFIVIGWIMFSGLSTGGTMDTRLLCGILLVLGVLMIIFSNFSGKIQQNRFFGVRLPWTLKNETVWKKTHRLSGFSGIIGGAVLTICSIIGMFQPDNAYVWCMAGLIIAIPLLVVIPTIYSYCLYRKVTKEEE